MRFLSCVLAVTLTAGAAFAQLWNPPRETDPGWSAVSNTVSTQASQGATAYGWGDHGTNGYLTAYSETDPVWTAASNDYLKASTAASTYAPIAEPVATNHIADTTDAHDASAISVTPTGGVAAVNVQAAIAELDGEKQAALGIGGVTATMISNTTVTAGSYTNAGTYIVDSDGRLTAAESGIPRTVITYSASATGTNKPAIAWDGWYYVRVLSTNAAFKLEYDWPAVSSTNRVRFIGVDHYNPNGRTVQYADTTYWPTNGVWTTTAPAMGTNATFHIRNRGSKYMGVREARIPGAEL